MLKLKEMDLGTKIRTVLAFVGTLVASYYTYQGLLDDMLKQLGWGKASMILALMAVLALIVTEAAATFFNNSYTTAGAVGTEVTRTLKDNPELVVDFHDVDIAEDDEDEDDEDEDEEEEGDDNDGADSEE